MPINVGEFDYLYRTSTGSYGNPMFKIGFHPLQPASNTQRNYPSKDTDEQDDPTDAFELGDTIKGKDFDGHTRVGVIIKIEKDDEGDGTVLVIQDQKSNKRKRINPSSATKTKKKTGGDPDTSPDNTKMDGDGIYQWSPFVNTGESIYMDSVRYRLHKKYIECPEKQRLLIREAVKS